MKTMMLAMLLLGTGCGEAVALQDGETDANATASTAPALVLELRNTASQTRDCELSVTHQGVTRELYRGPLQPGELRNFGAVASEPTDFQVTVRGGCQHPTNDPRAMRSVTLAVGMRQTCTLTYHEPVAVLVPCGRTP